MKRFALIIAILIMAAGVLALSPLPVNAQTAPATATPQPQLTATVRTDGVKRLHVRAGPGTRYAIVDRLHHGEVYPAVGRDASNKWVQIALTGRPHRLGFRRLCRAQRADRSAAGSGGATTPCRASCAQHADARCCSPCLAAAGGQAGRARLRRNAPHL